MKCKIENLKLRIGSLWNFYVWQFLIPLSSFLILCGCVHREFEYESSQTAYLDVVFDWVNEPTANPGSMSLYLFPQEGGIPYRYDFTGRDGGTIRLNPGVYHAVCINSDENDIAFRGEDAHPTFEVYMKEATAVAFGTYIARASELPRATGAENQTLAQQPPILWSSSQQNVNVAAVSSKATAGNTVLTMQPQRIVDTYVVEVRNIKNIEFLRALSASISDMADGYIAGRMTHNDNAATLSLDLSVDPTAASGLGQFTTFGHCAATARNHNLVVYAIMSDGNKYYFQFDVTAQVHNGNYILIDGLELPAPIGGGEGDGGFDPSVTDWQTVDVGIKM